MIGKWARRWNRTSTSRAQTRLPYRHRALCGGTLRVIVCIDTPEIIKRILTHLAVREADRIHNPRAPPLRAPAAELPVSPFPTVP